MTVELSDVCLIAVFGVTCLREFGGLLETLGGVIVGRVCGEVSRTHPTYRQCVEASLVPPAGSGGGGRAMEGNGFGAFSPRDMAYGASIQLIS